jgi:hypothetical protein
MMGKGQIGSLWFVPIECKSLLNYVNLVNPVYFSHFKNQFTASCGATRISPN